MIVVDVDVDAAAVLNDDYHPLEKLHFYAEVQEYYFHNEKEQMSLLG